MKKVNVILFLTVFICSFIVNTHIGAASQNDEMNWTEVKNELSNFNAIACNGKLFAAAGKDGTIKTSYDGIDWTDRISNTKNELLDIIWDGKKFVVTGSGSTVLTSSDGITWNSIKPWGLAQNSSISRILWAGEKYVVCTQFGIYSSKDFSSWEGVWINDKDINESVGNYIVDFAWNGKEYIGIDNMGSLKILTGGSKWANMKISDQNEAFYYTRVEWNGEKFIAWGSYIKQLDKYHGEPSRITAESHFGVAESEDGVNWIEREYNKITGQYADMNSRPETYWLKVMAGGIANYKNLAWNGKKYVAIIGNDNFYSKTGGYIISSIPPVVVYINGKQVQFDVNPSIKDGRALVPVRAIYEALGAKVEWDGTARTVTGTKSNTKVVLKIDSVDATVNGEHKTLDVPATIIDGRTLVPARFISESLGATVIWDGSSNTVNISY